MPVDQRIVIDFVDETREFEVKAVEVPPPGFPWWILGLIAAGVVVAVAVSKA